MACQIKRTKDGKINKVIAPNGKESKLFNAIHGNIFLADADTSLKIYTNAYTNEVEKMYEGSDKYKYDNGEPQLFYKAQSNKEYDNLEELLINEDFGPVSMGFKSPKNDKFTPIAKFTTKGSEKNEFLASKVREGFLSADRELGEDGVTRLKGKGEYTTSRVVNATFAADAFMAELGSAKVKVLNDGTIEMEFANGYSLVEKEDGQTEVIRTEFIPEYLRENPNVSNKVELVTQYVIEHNNPRPLDVAPVKANPTNSDLKSLETSLFAFIKSLGFTTTTLENYKKNYRTKYGKDPDIQALIDLSNKVVAFKEGNISIEDLTEEVAHLAIEAFSDQQSIEDAIKNVHFHPEYAEFYEFYLGKYAPFFKGEALERQVRKEILGKILKREFLSRFDGKNKTEEQSRTTSFLGRIWEWFTNLLNNNVKTYHRRALDGLNKRIADSVLNNNTKDFQAEFDENVNFFYNAMSDNSKTIESEFEATKRIIEDLFSRGLEQPTPNKAELDKLVATGNFVDVLSSVNTIIGIAENQLDILEANIRESNRKNELISTKDTHRYEVLKNNMIPTMENIINLLPQKAEQLNISDQNLLNRMRTTVSASEQIAIKMSRINPLMNNDKIKFVERTVETELARTALNDEEKAEFKSTIEGGFRDIGWLGKMFGIASHSKNPIIQLLHRSITKLISNTNRKFNSTLNSTMSEIDKKNLYRFQRSIIHRDANGNLTNYFLSPKDYHRYDQELRAKEDSIIANITGKSLQDVQRLRDKFNPREIIKDENLFSTYKEEVKKWRDEVGQERRFTDEYYKQRDARFEKANISDETRTYLSTKNVGRFSRRKKYMNPDGTIDLNKQTEAEKIEDLNDFKQHLSIKSAYDTSGNLKAGIRRVKYSELSAEERAQLPYTVDPTYTGELTVLERGQDIEDLSIESRRALDLFNLDMLYREELKSKARNNKPIQQFLDNILEIERKGEVAYEWVLSNSSLGLSSSFYENLGTDPTFNSVAQDFVDSIEDPDVRFRKQAVLNNLVETQKKRKELLKQNRSADSIIETDVKHMTTHSRKSLLELDSEIAELRAALEIPYETLEERGGLENMEVELNEDFERLLTESGLDAYRFSLQHMSDRSKLRTQEFAMQIDDFIRGKRTYIKKQYDEFVTQMYESGKLDNLTVDEISRTLKEEFAKRNVASYFKRFQPVGYTQMLNDMKSGKLKMSDVLNNKGAFAEQYPALQYLEISPEYSWSEDVNNEEFLNPNFKSAEVGVQPKYLNEEFFSRYGIKKEDYLALDNEDLSKLKPTKNQDEYAFLVMMTDIRQQSINNYGDTGKINKYLRPQVSKSTMEKVLSIHKGGVGVNIKDFFSDLAQSKIDEKEYGEQIDDLGATIKLIPKYFQTKLQSPDLVTENTIEAIMVDLKGSIRYQERISVEREVKAYEYKISQQRFKNGGNNALNGRILKKGEVSNYYEKAQEMADYYLYGIKQNRQIVTTLFGREVDLTQLFNTITNYIRNVNLGFNFISDLTSYTTGLYNNYLDTLVGDFYHKSSAAKASAQLPKMIYEYTAEAGKMRKTSKLAHLMEFFGVKNAEDRLGLSAYATPFRMANKSMFAASELANLPITPRNMLTILHDFKFHNGYFKSYNDFYRDMKTANKNMTKSEIDSIWKSMGDTFYENIVIDPERGVLMGDNFREKYGDKAEEEFEYITVKMTDKISQINQNVDSILSESDKIAAQRDAITNALLLHRSWFIINMTRKFKGKHFNIATGQIESGHYSNILNSTKKMITRRFISREDLEETNEAFDMHERANLVRFGFDAAGITILIFLANALLAGDDDDDSAVENLAQYITLRTTSETQSQNLLGMFGSVSEIYQDPIPQLRTFQDLYKGITNITDAEKRRYMYKQFLAYRRYEQLSDLQTQIQSYMFFNGEKGYTLIGVNTGKKGEEKEK
jgi:hypothetical protein